MEPLTPAQLEEIKQFDGPTICNALECFDVLPRSGGFALPGIYPRTCQGGRMIGYAATAKISARLPGNADSPRHQRGYYTALRAMAKPSVAVIQDIAPMPMGSFWGAVQATMHRALGAVGTITHGGVRDLDEADAMGFHFFASHVLVSHAYVHVVDHDCGVEVMGMTVQPGDLVYADKHGVVNIPHAVAPKLAAACRRIAEAEMPMLTPCRAALEKGEMPTIDEIMQWRGEMDASRKSACAEFTGK